MAVQNEILRARLREAFGTDPQETVAQKLHLTQGTISKILSGAQQPALETMYHVANEYNVSVDWLLGISDKKRITKENGENNYCSVVEAIHSLRCHGVAKIDTEPQFTTATIETDDPLLKYLLRKCNALYNTDRELLQNWMETKLTLFEDKPILYHQAWQGDRIDFFSGEAKTESNWLEVYEMAKQEYDEYCDAMGDDPGPFKG